MSKTTDCDPWAGAGYLWREAHMTWIRTIPAAEAGPELRRCYEDVYSLYPPEYLAEVAALRRPDGGVDSITAAHSLIPQALRHAMSAYAVLLSPELPLT